MSAPSRDAGDRALSDAREQSGVTGKAALFPGQGSQRGGMAGAWTGEPSFVRWKEADELLGWDVSRLGLEAGAEELRQPANCQIALFVHGVVLYEAWRGASNSQPAVTAGHSLGEYNALVAAGVLDFADALRLVDARARHTQAAADMRPGTMVACVGYDADLVRAACERAGAHVANDNADGQLVAAGDPAALARLKDELAGQGSGKVLDVDVGAAYHSPHMQPAVEPFGQALDAVRFGDAALPVIANVDAEVHTDAGDWPSLLRDQLVSPVRWRQTVHTLASLGITEVVELGASAVLTGLVKRTDRSLARRSVTTPADLEA